MHAAPLYIGLDVASAKLDVCFIDAAARTVRPAKTFPNDPKGWTALKTAIVAAARLLGEDVRVVCGMESTGVYHKGVEATLRKERRRKLEVHVLNPRAVKYFAKAQLKDCKTDAGDAQLIALYLLRMSPKPAAELPELFEAFREATRTRRRFIEDRTEAKNRLHKLLRLHFPGLRSRLGKTLPAKLLLALEQWPAPDLILAQSAENIAGLRYGRGHRAGQAFAAALREVAEEATHPVLPHATQLLIQLTTRRILDLDAQLVRLDAAIEELLDQLFPGQVLTTIPGLGKVSAAAILAEVGDIGRFASKREFVGYCGLYPQVWESGETKRRYRMTRKGNRMLKMTLLIASAAARQYNPVLADFYERLRARGKSTKAAGGALARKLAELAFTLLVRGEAWDPEKAARGLAKAAEMATPRPGKEKAGTARPTGVEPAVHEGPRPESGSGGSRDASIAADGPEATSGEPREAAKTCRRRAARATLQTARPEDRATLESAPSAAAGAKPAGGVHHSPSPCLPVPAGDRTSPRRVAHKAQNSRGLGAAPPNTRRPPKSQISATSA